MTTRLIFGLAAILMLAAAAPATAQSSGEQRTANRTVDADPFPYPGWMRERPQYYEFTPMVSNHDPLHDHTAEIKGQEWDTSRWPASWTADKALRKFYAAGIFTRQDMGGTNRSVHLGPTFYTLSKLDQNRTLKLLTDQAGAFAASPSPVLLRDHATQKIVGSYGPTGLQMM